MHESLSPRRWTALALVLTLAACGTAVDLGSPGSTSGASAPQATGGTRLAYNGGSLVVSRSGARCQIRVEGEVNGNTSTRLHQAFAELDKSPCRDKTVVLAVNHGEVGSAITVGSMLRNRDFRSRVAAGSACLTPCWLVWVGGVERQLEPGARIGFSQVPPDEDPGRNRRCETELSRAQALTLTRYLRAMLPPEPASALFQRLAVADCRSTVHCGAAEARSNGLLGSSAM